ncbi:MAG: DUF177 domain-containing protein [bacterium]
MEIDVSTVLKSSGNTREYREVWEPEELDLHNELYRLENPLQVVLFFYNAGGVIEVDGSYGGVLNYHCTRCLTSLNDQLDGSVSARFYPPEKEITKDMQADAESDLYLGNYTEDETVEAGRVIRENIVLDRPMQILCKSDCAGLCQECGQNLNESDCGHDQESVDPRLAGLQDIDLSDDDESE